MIKKAQEEILSSVSDLQKMHGRRPNSFLMRVFFDSKANEVSSIFSGGPSVNISQLINTLNKISPTNASKWKKIKF